MHWAGTPIHYLDFEGSRASGILEYGIVTLRDGAVAEVRTRLCRATGRIAPDDTAVHGLDAAAVAGAEPFRAEWETFARLRETGPLAAHFAGVENGLLKSVWPYPRTAPDFAQPGRAAGEWGPWIDTGRLGPPAFGASDAGLAALVAHAGVQEELDRLAAVHCPTGRARYHAAPYDALAGAVLLLALLRRPDFADATIPWLLQMSTSDPDKRSALQQRDLF